MIKNKYHNKKTEVNGIIFDSKKELEEKFSAEEKQLKLCNDKERGE